MIPEDLEVALRRLRATALRQLARRLGLMASQPECHDLIRTMPIVTALDEIVRRRSWWFRRLIRTIRRGRAD